jgi:hypothetical protein
MIFAGRCIEVYCRLRRLISREMLYPVSLAAVSLVASPPATVVLYATHCVEWICDLRDPEALVSTLSALNLSPIISRLFHCFTIGTEFSTSSPRCLLRLVATGQSAIAPLVPEIISPAIRYLSDMMRSRHDPNVAHLLFKLVPPPSPERKCPSSRLKSKCSPSSRKSLNQIFSNLFRKLSNFW